MMPCLNVILEHLSKKQIRNTLNILFILLSVFPTAFPSDELHINFGYGALWLAVLCLVVDILRCVS